MPDAVCRPAILHRPGWALPDSAIAPEHIYLSRRGLLAGAAGFAGALALPGSAEAQWLNPLRNRAPAEPPPPDPSADLYPVARNAAYTLDRPLTPENVTVGNVNYYEFSTDKEIASQLAQAAKIRPWTITVDGLVEAPQTFDIDTLLRKFTLEERTYRLRCVEAWSIAVPWSGFPLSRLIELAKPLSSARYVQFQTFGKETGYPGFRQSFYPWPYTDAFTLAECTNELAFVGTGAYGKPLNRANGAPLRVLMPWKYGFKQPKGIVRIQFLEQRPKGFWEVAQGSEYGFWANVNPEVPHPRWSQAHERDLATGQDRPTQLFNGYGAYVADLYKDLKGERLFM